MTEVKWEHKTVLIDTKGFIRRGVLDEHQIDIHMRPLGKKGYELVSALPVSDGSVGTSKIALFFKRPVPDA